MADSEKVETSPVVEDVDITDEMDEELNAMGKGEEGDAE